MPITLIVEDGTRPTGANTYAAIATADAYHADRAFDAWADATADEKATALIKATDYLNGLSWNGRKVAPRVMAWPRIDMWMDGYHVTSDEVPDAVVSATCYMAGEFIGGADPLAAQDRALKAFAAGPVKLDFDTTTSLQPQYPALRSILRGLVGAQNVVRLVAG
jgi:hypothetical protein